MTKLSRAARAVPDAIYEIKDPMSEDGSVLAAALRAAALYCPVDRRILMTIADELENQ